MNPVVPDEVIKIISKFDQNKSPGHDDSGNFIVKTVAKSIAEPLAIFLIFHYPQAVFLNNLKLQR